MINHLIFFTVVAILVIVVKSARTVVKASKRINLLYDYFIVNQKVSKEDLVKMASLASDGPDPNDGSGCPKESDLQNEG